MFGMQVTNLILSPAHYFIFLTPRKWGKVKLVFSNPGVQFAFSCLIYELNKSKKISGSPFGYISNHLLKLAVRSRETIT